MRPVTARGYSQRGPQRYPTFPVFLVIAAALCCTGLMLPQAYGFDLANTTEEVGGFVINGIDQGDRSGISVSGAGDVNGDGLDDVIVGAFQASTGLAREGAAYVVFGKADTTEVDLRDVEAGIGGFAIRGVFQDDWLGFTVSRAGDVNGDGLDDLIVGQYFALVSYVVFGKTDTTLVNLADILDGLGGGFVIFGPQASAFGAVSGGGDVNNDGLDDLIVGSGIEGDAFVVFGKADILPVNLFEFYVGTIQGFNIWADDFDGGSVAHAGDVNGDGFDDVIVGYHGENPNGLVRAGRSYVVFGKVDTDIVFLVDISDGIVDDPPLGYVINGVNALDESGFSVGGAGDVNGDALDDVVIGAPYSYSSDVESGECYVVFGKANTAPVELLDVVNFNAGGFAMFGAGAQDFTGFNVSGAGDVNGDSFDDVIVGAIGADTSFLSRTGRSYIVYGRLNNQSVDLGALGLLAGEPLIGIAAEDQSGISVSGAGDVNGDGFADVIFGADSADPSGRSQAGQAYVVFGGSFDPRIWVDFIAAGVELGSFARPMSTLSEALDAAPSGGTIVIKGDSHDTVSSEVIRIDQPVVVRAVEGLVRIGAQTP